MRKPKKIEFQFTFNFLNILNFENFTDKIKQLEQEIKCFSKTQQAEIQNYENLAKSPQAKRANAKSINVEKEMREIGVNTTTESICEKPLLKIDRSIATDEFYHIKDNPLPVFCQSCKMSTNPRFTGISTLPVILRSNGTTSFWPVFRDDKEPQFGK